MEGVRAESGVRKARQVPWLDAKRISLVMVKVMCQKLTDLDTAHSHLQLGP